MKKSIYTDSFPNQLKMRLTFKARGYMLDVDVLYMGSTNSVPKRLARWAGDKEWCIIYRKRGINKKRIEEE